MFNDQSVKELFFNKSLPHCYRRMQGTRRKRTSFDRISNLPKEVIGEILRALPIRDAVKTSVLSTKWRYQWTSMPGLKFDANSSPLSIRTGIQKDDSQLVNFVNNVLLLHNGAITKFELDNFLSRGCSEVDRWIVVLSRKMVHHLVLKFKAFDAYCVPGCLFTCESLKTLWLENCCVRLPSQYNGFSHLTELSLYYVTITNETFESLVVKIPLLKVLQVIWCGSLSCISVHAPNLDSVKIFGDYKSIEFHSTPNLIKGFTYKCNSSISSRCRIDEVLRGLDELQEVELWHPWIESLPIEVEQKGLQAMYHHLKRVTLRVNLQDLKQIWAIIFLCRSSPCLEVLNITTKERRDFMILYELHFWEARLRKQVVFHHLKSMSLTGFRGLQHEMGLIQFILLNAVVLETVDIFWGEEYCALMDNEKLYVVQKMMQFERASSKAKVVFLN